MSRGSKLFSLSNSRKHTFELSATCHPELRSYLRQNVGWSCKEGLQHQDYLYSDRINREPARANMVASLCAWPKEIIRSAVCVAMRSSARPCLHWIATRTNPYRSARISNISEASESFWQVEIGSNASHISEVFRMRALLHCLVTLQRHG